MQAPPPAEHGATARPPPDTAALRRQAIGALRAVITAPWPASVAGAPPLPLAHDPGLRRRTEAVETLARFPDPEAAAVLSDLLLWDHPAPAAGNIPPPARRWLRDSALLALLRSTRLPGPAIDRALARAYSIARYPLPWQWSAVYDDLPLLSYYGRLGVFFRAFWLWPLILLAAPTFAFLWPILTQTPLGGGGAGRLLLLTLYAVLVLVGTGLEIYLIHQILIALLAGWRGAPLRVPGGVSAARKATILAVLSVALLGLFGVLFASDLPERSRNGVSVGALGLGLIVAVLPLLLLPMFMLAHDVEQEVRYTPPGQRRGLRAVAWVLRRATDLGYIILLPALAGAIWAPGGSLLLWLPIWLIYLFAVPFVMAGALRLLTHMLAQRRRRASG